MRSSRGHADIAPTTLHSPCMHATQVEAELLSVQQQRSVSQVQLQTLQAAIRSRTARLAAEAHQLEALAG